MLNFLRRQIFVWRKKVGEFDPWKLDFLLQENDSIMIKMKVLDQAS